MALTIGQGLPGLLTGRPFAGRSAELRAERLNPAKQFGSPSPLDERPEPLRAGFGEGTVSLVGVTASTVNKNLQAGRRLVPTLEEASAEARERAATLREQQVRERPPVPQLGNVNFDRNEFSARAQVRGFVDGLNSGVERAFARTGADATQGVRGASARVQARIIGFGERGAINSFDVFG